MTSQGHRSCHISLGTNKVLHWISLVKPNHTKALNIFLYILHLSPASKLEVWCYFGRKKNLIYYLWATTDKVFLDQKVTQPSCWVMYGKPPPKNPNSSYRCLWIFWITCYDFFKENYCWFIWDSPFPKLTTRIILMDKQHHVAVLFQEVEKVDGFDPSHQRVEVSLDKILGCSIS